MAATASLSTTVIPDPIDRTQQGIIVYGTIALTGSYTANGDTLNFATLGLPSNQIPMMVEIFETTPAPGPGSGKAFVYLPGTTQANGLLEIFTGGVQQTAGAYGTPPFAIAGFQLSFQAMFPFGV